MFEAGPSGAWLPPSSRLAVDDERIAGVGLYKICEHRGRQRDRCRHAWWGSFRGVRVSLAKWTNREIDSKAEAAEALDELRRAIRNGTFHARGFQPPKQLTTLTFNEFADIYKERHVQAKRLAIAETIDYRLKPLIDRFGDRVLAEIKTADIEDFIADLKKPRVVNRQPDRTLSPSSINRVIELMRHMMNWAVGREYLDRTPFRRGTETLIRKQHEDNQRRRRLSEDEEINLLAVAPPFLRSMITTALDTGMRQGEMLALRFGDVDWERQLIFLRGETTKSRKTRIVPISTTRLKAVLDWLRLDAEGDKKSDDALVFSDEAGEPIGRFRTAWVTAVLKGARRQAGMEVLQLDGADASVSATLPAYQPALARPPSRVRVTVGREGRAARPSERSPGPRIHHDDGALRQPEAREPAGRGAQAREWEDVRPERYP
jgi:integrase